MAGESAATELKRGWPVILVAALGCGTGISALMTYNVGLFVSDLQADIGLTRGAYGAAFLLTTIALALVLPALGRLVDRGYARIVGIGGAMLLAASFGSFAVFTTSPAMYLVLMALMGLLGAGSSPLVYTRAVSAAFERARGLALGFTLVGIGASAAIMPPLVTAAITSHGWRTGFYVLAAAALLGILPAAIGLRNDPRVPPAEHTAAERAAPAIDFAPVFRNRIFWLLIASVATMAIAFVGIVAHLAPLLREKGLSAEQVGGIAGLMGLATLFGRVVIGWLIDNFHAPRVAAGMCVLCAGGCLSLLMGGVAFAPLAAIALGATMGAEADLVGFLTARYFGMRVYGRAYAWQFAAFLIGSGLSPLWVGILADRNDDYSPALMVTIALLLCAAALFCLLPRGPSTTPE